MKYFTPDLIEQLDSPNLAVADAAEVEWDRRLEEYEAALKRISRQLPDHIQEFNQLLLHDAVVCTIARHGDQLLMVLRKDIPPRGLVILTYALTEEPSIDREALPPRHRSPVMDFLYDEFELVRDGSQPSYTQSILFGNGWEMKLRFHDVRVTWAESLYPAEGMPATTAAAGRIVQPA